MELLLEPALVPGTGDWEIKDTGPAHTSHSLLEGI